MKLELRERTEAHVRLYFQRTQDAEIRAMLPMDSATVEQAVEKFRMTCQPGATSFGRTIYADGAYVGDVWCYCIDPSDEPGAMLSYCVFEKSLWGTGIATEAVGQFLREIVRRFDLGSVGAFTYCANGASIRVLEKNGFALVETLEEDGVKSAYYQKNTGNSGICGYCQ